MFPSNLITPIIALGSGCIVICISIFHYFRDRVDKHIHDEMTKLFSSEETTAFLEGIEEGTVTSTMFRDFYNQLSNIWKPKQLLRSLWTCFPTSGAFFIGVGLLGSLVDYENLLYDYIVFSLLLVGTAFFIVGIIQLIRLGRKLM